MIPSSVFIGISFIILLLIGYVIMIKLKIEEIIGEVKGTRESLEEIMNKKIKKVIELKGVVSPYAGRKLKNLFNKLNRVVDDMIKSNVDEKLIKNESLDEITNQIIKEAKKVKELLLDEDFHLVLSELEAIENRLAHTKKAYRLILAQYKEMKTKFPFSVFPWPKWEEISTEEKEEED